MKKIFTMISALFIWLINIGNTNAQVNISVGNTVTQDFTIGTSATAALPSGWKADKNTTVRLVGAYSSAVTATEQRAGNSMSTSATNGIYNYAAGDPTTATDRAIGGLSSSSASKSVNVYVQLTNNGSSTINNFTISYDVEKYRNGSNPAGFSIQMYYSTDGMNWTSAGTDFLTSFSADTDNNGYATAPGSTVSVSEKTLNQSLAASSSIYLAWNYSVTSGTTTSNAQALGIDNVSITANSGSTPLITVNPSSLTGFNYVQGSGPSSEQSFSISGSNLTDDISITPPTNYEISTGTGGSFSATNPITLNQSGGTVDATTIYVRLKAGLSAGNYNNETITASSTDADNKTVTCNGTVYKTEPTNHVTDFNTSAGTPTHSAINLSWTDAAGGTIPDGYLIKGSNVGYGSITNPIDGTAESDGGLVKNITQGTQSAIFSGLSANTTYYFKIFPYTNSGTNINYKIDGSVPQADRTTAEAPSLPKVIITEVADHSTFSREYIEIYNADDENVSIDGWIIKERFGANTTDERTMTLNASNQKNSEGTDYLILSPGEYAIILRSETISTFKAAYSIGNDIAIFQNIIPQMNGNERYQLENSTGDIIDSFGDWDRSPIFEVVAGNCYERINGVESDGQISTNWASTSNESYTYTPGSANNTPLPVELTSFIAAFVNNGIVLNWQTATEVNNYGFEVERAEVRGQGSEVRGQMSEWEKIGFVAGHGNSNSTKDYSFTDNTISTSGKYAYRLKQIDTDGSFSYSQVVETDVTVNLTYSLGQNYPNPFNPTTRISYTIPETGLVTLKVYNLIGETVAELVNQTQEAGKYEIEFNGSSLSNGVYFYELKANGFTSVKKLMLLK